MPDLTPWVHSVAGSAVLLPALPALICAAAVGALFATGAASWHRTSALRKGMRRAAGSCAVCGHGAHPTSRLTTLAATAGAALLTTGIGHAFASPQRSILDAMNVTAGLFVALSGIRLRVTSIELGGYGMVIRYARSPPHAVPWIGFVALRPPAWPMGGWRLDGSAGSRSLMPSDLWGNEEVLDAIIERAGLTFDGRSWSRLVPLRVFDVGP